LEPAVDELQLHVVDLAESSENVDEAAHGLHSFFADLLHVERVADFGDLVLQEVVIVISIELGILGINID